MNRAFKIVLWIIILVILYSVLSVTYQKCTETSKEMLEQASQSTENIAHPSEGTTDSNDEFFSDEDAYNQDDIDLADQLFDDEVPQFEKTVEPATGYEELKVEPQSKPNRPANPSKNYSSSSGKYMVVAGSFLVEANAGNMVRKLNNLGYPAESVVFDDSQYYTVLASRSDDYNQALSVSSQLKSRGIDNYVKSQKF